MRILIDTNVLIDYIAQRAPYENAAEQVLLLCKNKAVNGCVAAHSLMNIFYILRKSMSVEDRKAFLLYLSQITEIVGIDRQRILNAVENTAFSDFEDSLQEECADSCTADWIVTRNVKDFQGSRITPVTPDEFLTIYFSKTKTEK